MSTWRVAQHYGFGAARIPIHPEPHRLTPGGLRDGLTDVRAEFVDGGFPAMARRVLGQSPAIALCLLLTAAFLVTLLRDHSDRSPIEIVLLENTPLPLDVSEPIEPVIEEVVPEPIARELPKPVERVELVAPVAPKPPPPEVLVQRPPPPAAKPLRPKPPVMPKIARVEKPKPVPAMVPNRPERARPRSIAKPRVAVDAVAPRVAPMEEPAPRAFRVAATPNAKRVRTPSVQPDLALSRPAAAAPPPDRATRSRADLPKRSAPRAPRIAPSLAAAPSLAESAAPTPVRRESRAAPRSAPRRAPRPTAQMASARVVVPPSSAPTAASRVSRIDEPGTPRGAVEKRPGLAGVPLADLAVCLSDREEDRLKQAVVAAVTTQKECVSRAGTYRFVETKNLNAFLMRIDRVSGRSVGDRCDELRNALECLQVGGQRASR
jgi:hypothetical protein